MSGSKRCVLRVRKDPSRQLRIPPTNWKCRPGSYLRRVLLVFELPCGSRAFECCHLILKMQSATRCMFTCLERWQDFVDTHIENTWWGTCRQLCWYCFCCRTSIHVVSCFPVFGQPASWNDSWWFLRLANTWLSAASSLSMHVKDGQAVMPQSGNLVV